MAGKTTSRYIKVLFDDAAGTPRDLSDSVKTIGGIGLNYDAVDVTALANEVKQYLSGRGDSPIEMSGTFNNTADVGAHVVIAPQNGQNKSSTLTIQIGSQAAPTTGDPEWEGEYSVFGYTVNAGESEATWASSFKPMAGAAAPAWGTVSA